MDYDSQRIVCKSAKTKHFTSEAIWMNCKISGVFLGNKKAAPKVIQTF
jgi:hypothetical protein